MCFTAGAKQGVGVIWARGRAGFELELAGAPWRDVAVCLRYGGLEELAQRWRGLVLIMQPSAYAMERIGVRFVGKRILSTDCTQSRLKWLDGDGVSIFLAPCLAA